MGRSRGPIQPHPQTAAGLAGHPLPAGPHYSIQAASAHNGGRRANRVSGRAENQSAQRRSRVRVRRSEEHTSELQSRLHLVCRLLLEKKKNKLSFLFDIPHSESPCTLPTVAQVKVPPAELININCLSLTIITSQLERMNVSHRIPSEN